MLTLPKKWVAFIFLFYACFYFKYVHPTRASSRRLCPPSIHHSWLGTLKFHHSRNRKKFKNSRKLWETCFNIKLNILMWVLTRELLANFCKSVHIREFLVILAKFRRTARCHDAKMGESLKFRLRIIATRISSLFRKKNFATYKNYDWHPINETCNVSF